MPGGAHCPHLLHLSGYPLCRYSRKGSQESLIQHFHLTSSFPRRECDNAAIIMQNRQSNWMMWILSAHVPAEYKAAACDIIAVLCFHSCTPTSLEQWLLERFCYLIGNTLISYPIKRYKSTNTRMWRNRNLRALSVGLQNRVQPLWKAV